MFGALHLIKLFRLPPDLGKSSIATFIQSAKDAVASGRRHQQLRGTAEDQRRVADEIHYLRATQNSK